MQTRFTPVQLENDRLTEANAILRKCVHCGLCTATCPTYVLLGDERDSPRGRIYLIKDMLESGGRASPEVTHHVDRCLTCLSCMTTCPSGVDYMHLVDIARQHIEKSGRRSIRSRMMRRVLAMTLPYPGRFRLGLLAAALFRPLRRLLGKAGFGELAAMLELAPAPWALFGGRRAQAAPAGEIRGRVIMLEGCAQKVLRPDINAATVRLLSRMGYEVVTARDAGCCGALVQHMGRERKAISQARRNVDAWWQIVSAGPLDAIVINASGCGTMVKDYGHLLKGRAQYERKAVHIAALTKDISEFLAGFDLGPPKRWSSLRIAYHSACSMQHGQRVSEPPRELLRKAGFAVVEIPEGHICCGSAGTYNLLQPELAGRLLDRKVGNIALVKPDIIATGNIGCITQLQSGTAIPVVHTVELLDWAYGGPCPRGLEQLEDRVSDVPDPGVLAPAAE